MENEHRPIHLDTWQVIASLHIAQRSWTAVSLHMPHDLARLVGESWGAAQFRGVGGYALSRVRLSTNLARGQVRLFNMCRCPFSHLSNGRHVLVLHPSALCILVLCCPVLHCLP